MIENPLLEKLRSIRHECGVDDETGAQAIAERLASRNSTGPIPYRTDDRTARVQRFAGKAEAVQSATVRLQTPAEVPQFLAGSLRDKNLAPAIRIGHDPAFAQLDWGNLEVSHGAGRLDEPVAVSRAALGVAETGSLVLLSGPDNPVTLGLLGEHHYVMLYETDVVDSLEAVWSELRTAQLDPRTVNFVTGPSRSADIEQRLELGAHGPVALTIMLVAENW